MIFFPGNLQLETRKQITLSKSQFLHDNYYLVTVTKGIVMVTKNTKGDKN